MRKTLKSNKTRLIAALAAVVLLLTAACALYVGDYYRADSEAIAAFSASCGAAVHRLDDGMLVFAP